MSVTSDWAPIEAQQRKAAALADADVARDAQARAARRTGYYASQIAPLPQRAEGERITGGVVAGARYSATLEHGRDVGPRKGPHMAAQPAIGPAGDRWGEHYERHAAELNR